MASAGLAADLTSDDPVVARRAELEVRADPDAAALSWLLHVVGQDRYESVPRVARAIAAMGAAAGPEVAALVANPSTETSQALGAARVFRFHQSPDVAALLLDAVSAGPPPRGPWPTLVAVGELGDPAVTDALVDRLRDPVDRGLADDELTALERTLLAQTSRDRADLVRHTFVERLAQGPGGRFTRDPTWVVFRLGTGWIDAVIEEILRQPDADPRLRARAASWLGMAAVGRAVPDLGRVASSTSEQPDVRTAAVRALGEGGQPSALQLVASAARVADDPAFAVAIDGSLARLAIHSEDPISLLRDVLERARPAANIDAQAEALRSLGALKAERDLVREHLVDPDGYVRGAAALALADMADRDAIATARSQASEGLERVQMAAAAAKLGEQGAADDLHALLVGRDAVDGPIWALRSSVKRAIVDAFDAAEGHPGSDRALAWNEVLHLEPDAIPPRTAAATPPSGPPISNAANGEQMSIGTQAAPPPADGRPVAPPPGPEPTPSGRRPPRGAAGAGLPSSQADPAASVDRLGRAPMVNVLTAMLDDDQQGTPFTFALFGSWGAGKSSVLRMLHDQLTKPSRRHELLVATFNAWSFEKTDNIAAGLAQETFDAIVPAGSVRRLAFRLRYGLRAHRARLLGVCAVLVTSLVSAGYGLVVGTRDDSIAKVLIGTGGLTVFSLIGTVAIRLYQHPIASEVLTSLRLPDYRAQVGPLQRMRDELEQAWALRRAQLAKRDRHGRLVIFVDDLDRCSPEAITATLDAIRLVVALDECIVIIALDERIGLRAIAAEYEALAGPDFDDEDVAREFLAKIIQLPVRLAPPAGVEEYVREELFRGSSPPRDGTTPAVPDVGSAPPPDRPPDGPASGVPPPAATATASLDADVAASPDAATSAAFAGGGEPAAATYGSSTPSTSTVVLLEAMREHADEVDEFVRLVSTAGFTNPRQLRRLRNSYRFVKAFNPGLDWQPLMVAIMWQELLHTLPAERHSQHLGRPGTSIDGDRLDLPMDLIGAVRDAFETDESFDRYREAVLVTVLPRLDVRASPPASETPTISAVTS